MFYILNKDCYNPLEKSDDFYNNVFGLQKGGTNQDQREYLQALESEIMGGRPENNVEKRRCIHVNRYSLLRNDYRIRVDCQKARQSRGLFLSGSGLSLIHI